MMAVTGLRGGVAELAILLCWLTAMALYGLVLLQPHLVGRPHRHRLSPAAMRFIATGQTDPIALAASLLQLAASGYLSIIEGDDGLILQRTWRQEAHELDILDAVIANALFRGKPTHCPLSAASQDILAKAREALAAATQQELMIARLSQATFCLWVIAAPLILGVVLMIATGRMPLLDMLFVGGAAFAIFLNLLTSNSDLRRAEFFLLFISILSILALEGWLRASLLVLMSSLALAAKQRLSNAPAAHRSLARHVELRAKELVAASTITPSRFLRDYPVAVALAVTRRWIGASVADASTLSTLRPRWYQAPDRLFDPAGFAQRLGQTLTDLLSPGH